MTRLSEEREKEIRRDWTPRPEIETDVGQMVRELLDEIDALRAELDDARETRLAIKLVRCEQVNFELTNEINALRAENERLQKFYDTHVQDLFERDEKMKCETGCVNFTGGEVKHHKDCVFYSGSVSKIVNDLKAENEKLRSRIAALREALDWLSKTSIHSCDFCGAMNRYNQETAKKALAQDDDSEGGK